jgi:hypothetical protein
MTKLFSMRSAKRAVATTQPTSATITRIIPAQ